MGEKKMVFFPHFHIFPPWTMLYLVLPSQTVTVLVHENEMFFTLGLNVHSSACKLQ